MRGLLLLLLFLPAAARGPGAAEPKPLTALDAELEPWKGDFDGMLERRMIRVLVPYSRTLYFNDGRASAA